MDSKIVNFNVRTCVDDYLGGGDISKENANMLKTPNGLLFSVGSEGLKKDNLKRLEDAGFGDIVDLHKKGGIHIHDLGMGHCCPYCIGLSFENVINYGITSGPAVTKPPMHFRTVINQAVNIIGATCNEVAGAIAYNGIDLYLGAYAYKYYLDMKKSGVNKNVAFQLTRKEVKQSMQEFIFHLNQTNRFGGQSPFSNVTLDITVPEDMVHREAIIGGIPISQLYNYSEDGIIVRHKTYGELNHWQRLVCEIFIDLMSEGDASNPDGNGKGHTFPVLTVNTTDEFLNNDENKSIRDKIFKLTAKYGSPFFQNFINGESGGKKMNPQDVRAMCPFQGDEKVIIRENMDTEPIIISFKDLYEIYKDTPFLAKKDDDWFVAKAVKVKPSRFIEIYLQGEDKPVVMEKDHYQPCRHSIYEDTVTLKAEALKVGDYLPYNLGGDCSYTIDVDGYCWKIISKIQNSVLSDSEAFCLSIDNKDHLFELANGLVTHNCRLSLDLKALATHSGGLFGNGDSTGSIQVITLSLPYIAEMAKNSLANSNTEEIIDIFFETLFGIMDRIKGEQLWKREIIDEFYHQNFFPSVKANIGKKSFDTFFTTFGFIGLNECVESLLNMDKDTVGLLNKDGLDLGASILEKMRDKVNSYIEETGKLFNMEATPAESAAYKLAKKALKVFPDARYRGIKTRPYFTNSCHIPVEYQDNLNHVFYTQDRLQTIPTGGTATHFYINEEVNESDIEVILRQVCKTRIPYFSLSVIYSMCPICGRIPGTHVVCPNKHTDDQINNLLNSRPDLVMEAVN